MKHLFILLFFFVTGCASMPQVHSEYEQKIDKNKKEMYDDGRDLIAKAKQMLENSKQKNPEIEKALDILEKGQILIESKVDDGSDLKNLKGAELDKAIDELVNKDKDLIEENQNLEEKDKALYNQAIAKQIGDDAVDRYKRFKSIKFYAIILSILGALGAYFYFCPTQALSILWKVVGFIKNIFVK